MTSSEIIEQFKALPEAERRMIARFILQYDKLWIPDSFRHGMTEADRNELIDMEVALRSAPPK
jgi:hypothetical protein